MLNLLRGEYQGTVRSVVSTGGWLIGLTDYNKEQSVPLLHTHENPHLSFGLIGRMAVGRKSNAGLSTKIEQFSYVRAGEEHQISLVTPIGKNINLELEPGFFNIMNLRSLILKSYLKHRDHLMLCSDFTKNYKFRMMFAKIASIC
jgi:hypothetical protein